MRGKVSHSPPGDSQSQWQLPRVSGQLCRVAWGRAPWVLPPSPGRVPVPLCWHDPSFSLQLVKTHNLVTTRNYIFGYHPHGIMGLGAFCNFSTEATEVSKKFPGIRPYLATLAGNFRMPVLREYLMSGGESSPRPAPAGLCCPGLAAERGGRGNGGQHTVSQGLVLCGEMAACPRHGGPGLSRRAVHMVFRI